MVGMSTKRRKPGRPAKYPWKRWSNGRTYRAVKGRHFTCSARGFASTVHQYCWTRNLRAVTTVQGETVIFKILPRESQGGEATDG